MTNFKEKECKLCGDLFKPAGPAAKYCTVCGPSYRHELQNKLAYDYKIRTGLIKEPGVGKGGNQYIGEDHPQYTNGRNTFKRRRLEIREELRFCNRCSKDLKYLGPYHWVLHHIDWDRENNTDDNYELLCKRCHQLEHDCEGNLI